MDKVLSLLVLIFVAPFVFAETNFDGRWIDLTHAFSEESIYWPTADSFKKTTVAEGDTEAGYYYSAYNFSAAEHGGTHLDAPIHFFKGGNSVDQVPVEQFIGNGVLIRIAEKAKLNRNYQFSVADILKWEKQHGAIEEGSILLIDTGSSHLWPDMKKYMGTDERGEAAVGKLKFPGIHPDAANFLIAKRKIKAVGLDTPSIDYGGSRLFKTHQILYGNNVLGFENVANLDKLPAKGFMIIALPMKIKGGSGAPLRIVAFIPAYADVCNTINSLSWLVGSWHSKTPTLEIVESWKQVSTSTLEGRGSTRSVKKDKVLSAETLRLVEMSGEVFFLAKVASNNMPVPFKLTKCTGSSAFFENPKHDFPKKLEYQFIAPDKLSVLVTGSEGKGFTIDYTRLEGS